MLIYYGSTDIVSVPEIREANRTLDYGCGFYATFALFEGHIISKQALIAELKTYRLVDQYLFHTEQALKCITFIEAKEIRL